MSVSIKDLSSLIFGFDDEEVREARAFHIRRPGCPAADMPYMVIPSRVAEGLLAIAGADNVFHIQEHEFLDGKRYHTLWQRQLWLESNEKKYLASQAWTKIKSTYFAAKEAEAKANKRQAHESWRFHTMAVRFRSVIRSMKLSDCRAIIDQDWLMCGKDEAKFKEKISKYEEAAKVTIYIPPYEEETNAPEDQLPVEARREGTEEDQGPRVESADSNEPGDIDHGDVSDDSRAHNEDQG